MIIKRRLGMREFRIKQDICLAKTLPLRSSFSHISAYSIYHLHHLFFDVVAFFS